MSSQRLGVMVYIVLLAMLMVVVHGGEVSMSIEADGYPSHFYSGTNVNITCTASGVTDNQGVGLIQASITAGCSISRAGAWRRDVDLSDALQLTAPNASYCRSAPSSVSIVGTVSDKMENAQLYCYVYDGSATVNSTEKVTIGTIRAVPTNLRMVNAPTRAMRNVEITITCESDGAKPASAYNYTISQNGQLAVNNNSYTPPDGSTGNITLKCEDNIHPNLSRNVLLTKDIPLYYLDPPQSTERNVSLNPSYAGLTCDVSGYPVTYTWTCDDCTSADSSRDWKRAVSRDNGQVETIICTASVDSLPSVNITWTVTWSVDAPTPSPTGTPSTTIPSPTIPSTTTTHKPVDPVVVAVPVVASIVAVAVIAVVVYCCCIKKRSGAPADGKPTNGDMEQMKMTDKSRGTEPGSNIPGKPKHQKSKKQKKAAETPNPHASSTPKYTKDAITYAVLDHSHRSRETAIVKPTTKSAPPPLETVNYAFVDIAKTQQHSRKDEGDLYAIVSKPESPRSDSPPAPRVKPPPPPSAH